MSRWMILATVLLVPRLLWGAEEVVSGEAVMPAGPEPVAATTDVPAEGPGEEEAAAPAFEVEMDAETALAGMIALAESELAGVTTSLEVLALTEEVRSGEWEAMKILLGALQQEGPPCTLWFARPDGSCCTVSLGLTDKNLLDRPYFPKVMGGERSVGELVVSRSTGRKSVIVAVPVRRDDQVIGMLGASVFLDDFSRRLKEQMQLPKDVIFYALNDAGQTALNWNVDLIFQDPSEQGSASLSRAVEEILSTPRGKVEYTFNDRLRRVVFGTSPLTGWHFALGRIVE